MHRSSQLFFWVLLIFFPTFNFPSLSVPFLPASNVTLIGDAHFKNSTTISLTQELNCFSPTQPPQSTGVGRAFYIYPIRFLDFATNTTASFSCRFFFSITPVSPLCPRSDGFAFLITSNAASFSRSNGYMGLPDSTMAAAGQEDFFFAVEFDTSFNPGLGDINGNHIGIDVNSVISIASVDASSTGIDLRSGEEYTAWVEYRDSVKIVRVWVGHSVIRPPSPVLVAQIDLSKKFKEFMHVGFSASNGRGSAIHLVRRWRFRTFVSVARPKGALGEEGDCFMCSPEDLSSNNGGYSNLHSRKSKIKELAHGLGGLAAFVVFLVSVFAVTVVYLIRKKGINGGKSINGGGGGSNQSCRMPARLSLSEIKSATLGFDRNRVIGEGASSTVYVGLLSSSDGGKPVAVKRFCRVNQIDDCFSNCFTTEFATMVSCVHHKNLVKLLGWCCEGTELVLVYEYMSNGSLNQLLHEKKPNSARFLTLERRKSILLDVASALTYLHEECERQIIHRDVKTCNIMLDAEFNAKLGDFGLAEVYERSSSTREATVPAGTMGYLAPEYVYTGVSSEKTDVYSYGVVVLEVATGRKPVDEDRVVVVDWVWEMLEKGRLIDAADFRLMGGRFWKAEIEKMIMVGLICVHPNSKKRPSVKEAARILRGESPLPKLPARKPMVRIRPVVPCDSEEVMDSGGNWRSPWLDEAGWSTPMSHFSCHPT